VASNIHLKNPDESGTKRILIITAGNEMLTACCGQTMDCCLSPTIIMKHFWKSFERRMHAMEQEKTITLDLTGCKSLGEIHQRIKDAFDFPDFPCCPARSDRENFN
jgi:hypothetical protein